jgi:hypothetical protein
VTELSNLSHFHDTNGQEEEREGQKAMRQKQQGDRDSRG